MNKLYCGGNFEFKYKDYSPDNCRWVDSITQARNKTNTLYVLFNGENRKVVELAEEYNISYPMLYGRILHGWDLESALDKYAHKKTTPTE